MYYILEEILNLVCSDPSVRQSLLLRLLELLGDLAEEARERGSESERTSRVRISDEEEVSIRPKCICLVKVVRYFRRNHNLVCLGVVGRNEPWCIVKDDSHLPPGDRGRHY